MTGTFLSATVVEEPQVSTGETLESIAAEAGIGWQELAGFNWQTSDRKQVNVHLKKVVGCTTKSSDGKDYVLYYSDDPGIIHVLVKRAAEGLPVDQRHTMRVRKVRCSDIQFDASGKGVLSVLTPAGVVRYTEPDVGPVWPIKAS